MKHSLIVQHAQLLQKQCTSHSQTTFGEMTKKQPLRQIGSFEVTDFSTNRKPICDFLLVNNSNLHPISHHFRDFFVKHCQITAVDKGPL